MAKTNNKPSALFSRGGLLRALGTLLAVGLLIFLLFQQDWHEIFAAVSRIQVLEFVSAIALMFGSRFFVTARWHMLLRSGGVKASWGQSLRITFAGLFANNFLPSTIGGDVARLAGAVQLDFDPTVSAASLVADRLVGFAGMAFVLPLGLPYLGQINPTQSGLIPLASIAASSGWLQRGRRIVADVFKRLYGAIKVWLNQPLALFKSLLFTFGHMICLFGVIYVLLDGMHESLPFWTVAGLWSLVYAVTLLPISINGLGLQEVSIAYAFSNLGGLSATNGLVLALLIRTLYMLVSLPGAFFLPSIMPSMDKARTLLSRLGK